MQNNHDLANDEAVPLVERWYPPAGGGSDLVRYSLVSGNSPSKYSTSTVRNLMTSTSNTPDHAHIPGSNELHDAGPMQRRTSFQTFAHRNAFHNAYDYPRETTFGPSSSSVPDSLNLQPFQNTSPLNFTPYEATHPSGYDKYATTWESGSPISSKPGGGGLRASSSRARTRITPRHQHHQYLDTLLRSKCPKDRLEALNIAIQFRDEHSPTELIPNELLDELMEPADGDKYYCFCCPRAKKARTVTPARDHVRKSLGNFPFQCPNHWCHHSSLRQADLNKHMRTCAKP